MRKRYSARSYSQDTTAIAKPIRPPRKHPPAAEMIHTKTFAFRLAPATRLRNYPGRTNPDALGRYDPESLSMPPPATRRAPSGAPLRNATRAQPWAAGGRSADRHGPRTREGPQGDDPPAGLHGARGAFRASPRARDRAQKEKHPPRARRPALPQPGAAVLSAKAGLTAGFGMGPGDPRLCGRARGGRSPAAHVFEPARYPFTGATLAAAWRARKKMRIALGALIEDAKSSGY